MNITADTKIATDYIKRLRDEGAKAYQNRTESIPTAGIFKKSYEPWVADGGLERAGHISYFEETDMAYKCRLDIVIGTTYIKDAVVIAFVANETISIIENAGLMGIPIPEVLKKAIDVLNDKTEA